MNTGLVLSKAISSFHKILFVPDNKEFLSLHNHELVFERNNLIKILGKIRKQKNILIKLANYRYNTGFNHSNQTK